MHPIPWEDYFVFLASFHLFCRTKKTQDSYKNKQAIRKTTPLQKGFPKRSLRGNNIKKERSLKDTLFKI